MVTTRLPFSSPCGMGSLIVKFGTALMLGFEKNTPIHIFPHHENYNILFYIFEVKKTIPNPR
jgi:hypothetical protein